MCEFTKEQKRISKELRSLSIKLKSERHKNHHNEARRQINKKYGKGWRETLEFKKPINDKDYGEMSYY